MKPRKNFILIMLIGLLLAAFAVAVAQTPAQGGDKKKAESCCAMESSGDAKDSCCGCCDESCDMDKHDANMKHDKDHKDHKGDCCKMKQKDKTKEKKVA